MFQQTSSQKSVGRKTVGLALGGGAARGIAHVGVLKALEAYEIPIDFIAGASAGSVVGACYAGGIDSDTMQKVVLKLSWSDFASFHFSKIGMMSSKPIHGFIKKYLGTMTFSEVKIPFSALATDILTGKGKVFNEPKMELGLAVRASCSFPGVLDPTEINGIHYIDGGSVENVPISVARGMGADVVIAVDVIPKATLIRNPAHMMGYVDRGLDILLNQQDMSGADIVLTPLTEYFASRHFKHAERMVELGALSVINNIEKIKAAIS